MYVKSPNLPVSKPFGEPTWVPSWTPKFHFFWRNPSQEGLGGLRAGFLRVLKKDLKLKGSWDRFLVDFGKVLGAAGGAKTRFSLESGTNFHIFGYLKRRCLLDTKKHRFWLRFGLQVGLQNRSSWLQDGFVSNKIGKMRVPRRCQKNDRVFEPS